MKVKVLAVLSLTLAFFAHVGAQSPRELVRASRPLTSEEIATVLGASRDALRGKTLRLSSSPVSPGIEVLMGRAGRPKRMRLRGGVRGGTIGPFGQTRWRDDLITIVDYTERPARRCGAVPSEQGDKGEMVIDYTHSSQTGKWTVSARGAAERGGSVSQVFEMLQGAGTLTSGEHQEIRGRRARAFVAPWTPPTPSYHRPAGQTLLIGDPLPNLAGEPPPQTEAEAMTQWLWIDADSLLPLRWEASERGRSRLDIGYERFDLSPPAGLERPRCIP